MSEKAKKVECCWNCKYWRPIITIHSPFVMVRVDQFYTKTLLWCMKHDKPVTGDMTCKDWEEKTDRRK